MFDVGEVGELPQRVKSKRRSRGGVVLIGGLMEKVTE
jgi:hypothetical protein